MACSASRAASRASLRQTVRYELNLKFKESIRSRYASVASTGDTSFWRISSESSATDRKGISVFIITPPAFWLDRSSDIGSPGNDTSGRRNITTPHPSISDHSIFNTATGNLLNHEANYP